MLPNLSNYEILLASNSPRRKQLLTQLEIDFKVVKIDVNEAYNPKLQKEEITNFLALKKAEAVQNLKSNELLLTADTIVWHQNKALEKPENKEEAIKMLQQLSGNVHQVITSFCIKTRQKISVKSEITKVYFDDLRMQEIEFYVDKYQPFDKAGSYGIQEWIGFIGVKKIKGCYYNVMGLPVHKLYKELKKIEA